MKRFAYTSFAMVVLFWGLNMTLANASESPRLGISETTFRRNFLKLTRQTPLQFQLSIRLKHASKLLEETDFPVAEIAEKVGFDLPHYFTRLFTDKLGCSPKQHRDAHKKASAYGL